MTFPVNRHRLAVLALATATAGTAAVMGAGPAQAAPPGGVVLPAVAAGVADSYIAVLNDTATLHDRGVPGTAARLAARYGGRVGQVYRHALKGFEVSISPRAAQRLAANPAVAYLEQNSVLTINGTQSPVPSWGLDRIDQRDLPLDNSYTFPTTARCVPTSSIPASASRTPTSAAELSVASTLLTAAPLTTATATAPTWPAQWAAQRTAWPRA